MRYLPLGCIAVASLVAGCAGGVPNTPAYPTALQPGNSRPGAAFCQSIEEPARNLQNAQYVGAWIFGSLAVATTGGGAVVDFVNGGNERRVIGGTAMILGGLGMGVISYALFSRAETTGKLAAAANRGMAEHTDRGAFESCATAKAAWLGNKSDPAAIAEEFVRRQELEKRHMEEEIEQLKKGAPLTR